MKKLFLILLMFAGAKTTRAQKNMFIDTAGYVGYEGKTIEVSGPSGFFPDSLLLPDTLLKIDTITAAEFTRFAKKYSSKILPDSSIISHTDTSFTIKGPGYEQTYRWNMICECTSSTYLGLIEPLNLYMVNSVDMQNELAYTQLIDKQTGKQFEVPVNTDEGPQAVLISPKDQFLLSYTSTYFEHDNCTVSIMRVDRNKYTKTFFLTGYLEVYMDRLNILDLVWINEQSIALSVTDQENPEEYDRTKRKKYFLRISWPKKL